MSALQKYIDDLSNGIETDDSFPKNESSWEELFEFGKKRVIELAALQTALAQRDARIVELEAYIDKHNERVLSACPECGGKGGYHKTGCSNWQWEPPAALRGEDTDK